MMHFCVKGFSKEYSSILFSTPMVTLLSTLGFDLDLEIKPSIPSSSIDPLML